MLLQPKSGCVPQGTFLGSFNSLLTAFIDGVHGVQLGAEVRPDEVRHGVGGGELVGPGQQRPLGLGLGPGLVAEGPLGIGRVAERRAGQDGRRGLRGAVVLAVALHLALELGEGRAGLVLHGQVEHAGRHVVPHELDADLDAPALLPLLAWLGLQGVPAEGGPRTRLDQDTRDQMLII